MANLHQPNVFVQYRIKQDTPKGEFNDAIYYLVDEFELLSQAELEQTIQNRVDIWIMAVTNTAPPKEPTEAELNERLVQLQAEIAVIEEKIALIAVIGGDIEPPSSPQALKGIIDKELIVLSWLPARDDVALAGYIIYRDGEMIDKSLGEMYTDFTAEIGVEYTYYVSAYDKAGNESERSNAIQITL